VTDAGPLLRDGVLARATVVGVRDTGWRRGDSDDTGNPAIWGWLLRVHVPDGTSYDVTTQHDVPWPLAKVARPGRDVLVRVHPLDRAIVVVDAVETARWYGVAHPHPYPVERFGPTRRAIAPGRHAPKVGTSMFVVTGLVLAVATVVLVTLAIGTDGTTRAVLFGGAGLAALLALVFGLVGRFARRLTRPPRRSVRARARIVTVRSTHSEFSTATTYRVDADVDLPHGIERVSCTVLVPAVEESVFGEGRVVAVHVRPRRPRRVVPDWDATDALQR
jgi:hypothetical protein